MSKHEKVQDNSQLKPGEIFEFFGAVAEQLPRDLEPMKVRWYTEKKSRIGNEIRPLFARPIPVVPVLNVPPWQDFLGRMFGREFDLSNLHVPQKPDYACRALINPLDVTNNQIFNVCTKRFHGKTWRYDSNLDSVRDIVERPNVPYVLWVCDVTEADEDMKNKSADYIEREKINTETLFERQMHELKFFDETGDHLDIANWTLCAGSRSRGGCVPRCYWSGGKFSVYWYCPQGANPRLRARVAVS